MELDFVVQLQHVVALVDTVGTPMGTHSLSRNSLTTDAISYLVVSHPLLYRSCFKFKEHGVPLCRIIVCYIMTRRCLANFSLNYSDDTHEHARKHPLEGRANCLLSISLLHASLYSGVYLFILDEYARPEFGSFSKTPRNHDYLSVCALNEAS